MTEANALAAFMSALRKRLPQAVVFKHRDASFAGMPDCSITCDGHVLWLEAKLYPFEDWMTGISIRADMANRLMDRAGKGGPAQRKTLERLRGLYIIWVKKSFVLVCDPLYPEYYSAVVNTTLEAVNMIALLFENWPDSPRPGLMLP